MTDAERLAAIRAWHDDHCDPYDCDILWLLDRVDDLEARLRPLDQQATR